MSDLEFQRELSLEQMREALSLLDSTAGAQTQSPQIGDLDPAEEVDREADQSSTTFATQDELSPSEHRHRPKKPGNMAVTYYGLAIAAAGALAILSLWQTAPSPPPLPKIAHGELPNRPPVKPGIIASPAPPVAIASPDQNSSGLEPRFSTPPEIAGAIGHPSRIDDHGAVRDRAYSDGAAPYAAGSGIVPAMATGQAQWDEKISRTSGPPRRHARAVRVAAAKKRPYRQARAEINGSSCFFLCLSWPAQRTVSYEPPRNMIQ
jgi:hypothetical protein